LKRVFNIDVDRCAHCGGPAKVIADTSDRCIEDPVVIKKILSHLLGKSLSAEPVGLPESRATWGCCWYWINATKCFRPLASIDHSAPPDRPARQPVKGCVSWSRSRLASGFPGRTGLRSRPGVPPAWPVQTPLQIRRWRRPARHARHALWRARQNPD